MLVRYQRDDLLREAGTKFLLGEPSRNTVYPLARTSLPASLLTTQDKGTSQMAKKICGFPSRRWAAFFLGMLVGTVVVGCSMFGPGLGVSVY